MPYVSSILGTDRRAATTLALALSCATVWCACPVGALTDPPAGTVLETELLAIAEQLIEDKTGALDRVERALEGFRRDGDRRGEAACLSLLGTLGSTVDQATLERLERARRILEDEGHELWVAAVSRHLGRIELRAARLDRSEEWLRRSLDSLNRFRRSGAAVPAVDYWIYGSMLGLPSDRSSLPEGPAEEVRRAVVQWAEGAIRDDLGSLYTWTDRFAEADRELKRSLALLRGAGDAAVRGPLENMALLRRREGRIDEAREILEVLLAAETDPSRRADLFKALEWIERAAGDPARALERNLRSLRAAREGGDSLATVMLLRTRARLMEWSGVPEAADELYDEAVRTAIAADQPYAEAHVRAAQARLALSRQDYETVVSSLERAVIWLRQGENAYSELVAWTMLIAGYQGLGAFDRTERAIERALELSGTLYFPAGHDVAQALHDIGRLRSGDVDAAEILRRIDTALQDPFLGVSGSVSVLLRAIEALYEKGETEEVLTLAEEALVEARAEGDRMRQALALALKGHVLRHLGSADLARRAWEDALDVADKAELHQLVATILGGLAHLAWDRGERHEAVRLAVASVDAFEESADDVRSDGVLTAFLGSNALVYERAISGLIETERYGEAFLYTERARARALLRLVEDPGSAGQPEGHRRSGTEITAARERLRELEARIGTNDSRDLGEARRRVEDLLVRDQLLVTREAAREASSPLDLRRLQTEAIPEDTTMISYFLLGDRVVAWAIDRDAVRFASTGLHRNELDRIGCFVSDVVAEERDRGVRRLDRCSTPPEELSSDLYRKLVGPFSRTTGRQMLLVPHGPLHRLPFAALRNPETGRYLVEEHVLAVVPSASVLATLRARPVTRGGQALVIGDPAPAPPGLRSLPGARREAETRAALLNTTPLLGTSATERALREGSGAADVVHLAAHGIYVEDAPLFNHIALAPDEHDDGRLETHEIAGQLDLSRTDLVVLSACQTGLGDNTRGDEVLGLVRAFLGAGSRTVLATLWSVDDQTSALLIERFYRRLLAGESTAEALRAAQLDLLRQVKTRSPRFWAGFLLVGDSRPLGRAARR